MKGVSGNLKVCRLFLLPVSSVEERERKQETFCFLLVSSSLFGSYAKIVPDFVFVFLCVFRVLSSKIFQIFFHLVLQPKEYLNKCLCCTLVCALLIRNCNDKFMVF